MYAKIEVGKHYGYRRCPQRRGEPLVKVEILERKKPGKWRVRFVEEGQKDVVTSSTILAPWEEAEAFLNDERRMLKLLEACAKQWSGNPDDPIMDAVNLVYESTGEKDIYLDSLGRDIGHARMSPEAAKRILARAGIPSDPLEMDPLGFIDSTGKLHLSFAVAVQIAQAFAKSEPDTVLVSADAHQRQWETELTEPHQVDLLQNWRAGWTLARQWASGTVTVADRSLNQVRHGLEHEWEELWKRFADMEGESREETERLRSLVLEAVDLLRSTKADREADRLLLKLHQPSARLLRGSKRSA